LRNQLKDLCISLDQAIEKAVVKKPRINQAIQNAKGPKETLRIKQKELENAYNQLNIYKRENGKLKK
jgi:hypothetical protein